MAFPGLREGGEIARRKSKIRTHLQPGRTGSDLFALVARTGLDLRCGGSLLGLQGAPGALPSALGFESRLWRYTKRQAPPMAEPVILDGYSGNKKIWAEA